MIPLLNFLQFIVVAAMNVVIWLVIISAVLSWLVLFNVINIRHPVWRQIVMGLESVTRPLLRPLRRFIPPLGGMDLTPVILIIVLQGALTFLVGPFFLWLRTLVA